MDMKISYQEIQGHVLDLIRQLNRELWRPDYIVAINPTGLLAGNLISEYLEIPLYTLRITFVDGVADDCDHNAWMADDALGYPDNQFKKNILIVDHFNNTGQTFEWIRQDWSVPTNPIWKTVWGQNVRTAVIVNNINSRVEVDYFALEINNETSDFIEFPTQNWWKS